MPTISRKTGESILVGNNIEIIVVKTQSNRVTLKVTAPTEIPITRSDPNDQPDSITMEYEHDSYDGGNRGG